MNEFWWGVVITVVLGIPVSLAVNLVTPHAQRYLEERSGRIKEKDRGKAMERYLFIRALRNDDIRREMFVARQSISVYVVLAIGLLPFFAAIFLKIYQTDSDTPRTIQIAGTLLAGLGILFVYVGLALVALFYRNVRNLGRFADYEERLTTRFGPDFLQEAEKTPD